MKNNKFKILYDAELLSRGADTDGGRTGVYYTTLNILKSLLKHNNIKIKLYMPLNERKKIRKVIRREFPNIKFDILLYQKVMHKSKIENLLYVILQDKDFVSKIFIKLFIYMIFYIDTFVKYTQLFCNYLNYCKQDAIFSTFFRIPNMFNFLGIKKKYTFLHDVIPIILTKYYGIPSPDYWFSQLTSGFNHNDYYFTNSEYTRQDFLKYFPQIDPEKIKTTYVGCNMVKTPDINDLDRIKEKYNIPKNKKYLFSLCTMEPRKNLVRITKTFLKFVEKHNINDLILVMGGGNYAAFKRELDKVISQKDENKILQIGYVDEEDLPTLYCGAEWFTFTSEYEGFGSPVLEAMYCGCPVITSNSTSLPEVIGDAGIKIDWDSDEQHIEAYEKYYFDENLRKENSAKGIERAKIFTWDKTVDKMLEIMMNEK